MIQQGSASGGVLKRNASLNKQPLEASTVLLVKDFRIKLRYNGLLITREKNTYFTYKADTFKTRKLAVKVNNEVWRTLISKPSY